MKCLCYKCSHLWYYTGKNSEGKGYITCPHCYYKIRLDKAIVKTLEKKLPTANSPISKENYLLPTTQKAFVINENKEGDKLILFNDGLKVLIPRPKILLPMIENWSKRNGK